MRYEDLAKFCSKDETRTKITQPFTYDEWKMATNGCMLVAVKNVTGSLEQLSKICECNPSMISNISEIISNSICVDKFPKEHHIQNIGILPKIPVKIECDKCGGTGSEICDHCRCGHECPKCNGFAEIDTEELALYGEYEIDGLLFNPNFLLSVLSIFDGDVLYKVGHDKIYFNDNNGTLAVLMMVRR